MKGAAGRGFVPVLHGATEERPDEIDTLIAAKSVGAALAARGFSTEIIGLGLDLRPLERLPAERPLAVFNLVDALAGEARLAPMVPVLLERLCLPFTGAPAAAWLTTLSKIATKQALSAAGLPTPEWSEHGVGLDQERRVIVKPVFEHGSLGLDETSVVSGAQVAQLIAARNRRYRTPHFAERFVPGREFNLALLQRAHGVEVLPIAEILFEGFGDAAQIVGYDAKWMPESAAYHGTPRRFGLETEQPGLAGELQRLALRCWQRFDLAGYARVDFRVDEGGRPFILEVNINPCLSEDAGFAAAAQQAGLSYDVLIDEILSSSLGVLKASA